MWALLLQAWFIAAKALPVPRTTTVRTIKGVFIPTSLRLTPDTLTLPILVYLHEPAVNVGLLAGPCQINVAAPPMRFLCPDGPR